jgi:hypothetical protein
LRASFAHSAEKRMVVPKQYWRDLVLIGSENAPSGRTAASRYGLWLEVEMMANTE